MSQVVGTSCKSYKKLTKKTFSFHSIYMWFDLNYVEETIQNYSATSHQRSQLNPVRSPQACSSTYLSFHACSNLYYANVLVNLLG